MKSFFEFTNTTADVCYISFLCHTLMCAINSSTTATASSDVVTTLGEEDKPKAILGYLAH